MKKRVIIILFIASAILTGGCNLTVITADSQTSEDIEDISEISDHTFEEFDKTENMIDLIDNIDIEETSEPNITEIETETVISEAETVEPETEPVQPIIEEPEKPYYQTLNTAENLLPPNFIAYKTECWFNEHRIATQENNPQWQSDEDFEYYPVNYYAWKKFEDGSDSYCLMIMIDAEIEYGGENYNLAIPKYGVPFVGKYGSEINIIWENPMDENDLIHLMFQNGSSGMWVHENSLKGANDDGGYMVEMPVSAFDDGSGHDRYFVPLYAIINEVGGGAFFDPLGNGAVFMYTGNALQSFTGSWETSDRVEDRIAVMIGGEKHSIASYWGGLEIRPDGTFLESGRWYDGDEWVLSESKGRYVFFGRILVMMYQTESEYRGKDYTSLAPCKVDELYDVWDQATGAAVYARYIDDWDADYMSISGRHPMYANLAEKGEAAPRPGKSESEKNALPSSGDGIFSGILQEAEFYHDGMDQWIGYYYVDVGKDQLHILINELDDYFDLGEGRETEIHVYANDEKIKLNDYIGQKIAFKGEFFSGHTIHHRRNIVFAITEVWRLD